MKYPVAKVVVPKALRSVPNGQLPQTMLMRLTTGGELYITAARAFNAMYAHAKKDKITFVNIGDYRSLQAQYTMFTDRYAPFDTGRVPKVTRRFQNRTWWLKKGKSPSATPGNSNHGLGLAIDLATRVNGKTVPLESNKVAWNWILTHGPTYGFYLQGPPTRLGKPNPEWEAWHWQYCLGDKKAPYEV